MIADQLIEERLAEVEERRAKAHTAWQDAARAGATDNSEEAIRYDIYTALRAELRWVLGKGDGRY
jgi:hypothetical protein